MFQQKQEKIIRISRDIHSYDKEGFNLIAPTLQSLQFEEHSLNKIKESLSSFFKKNSYGNPWEYQPKNAQIANFIENIKIRNGEIKEILKRFGSEPVRNLDRDFVDMTVSSVQQNTLLQSDKLNNRSYADMAISPAQPNTLLQSDKFNIHPRVSDWFRERPTILDDENSPYYNFSNEIQKVMKILHSYPGHITQFILENTPARPWVSNVTGDTCARHRVKGRIEIYGDKEKSIQTIEGHYSEAYDKNTHCLYHHYFRPLSDERIYNDENIESLDLSGRSFNIADIDRFMDFSERFKIEKDEKTCIVDDTWLC